MIDSAPNRPKRRSAAPKSRLEFYGAPVGILLLERADVPFDRSFIPGSVGNAST